MTTTTTTTQCSPLYLPRGATYPRHTLRLPGGDVEVATVAARVARYGSAAGQLCTYPGGDRPYRAWEVRARSSVWTIGRARELRDVLRQIEARDAQRLAEQAARAEERRIEADLATRRTARELLAIPAERQAAWRALGSGKKYYASDRAPRSSVIEAVQILHLRHVRKSARGVAEAARRGDPNRIPGLLASRRAARAAAADNRLLVRLQRGTLGAAATKRLLADGTLRRLGLGTTRAISDQIVRAIVRCVGSIGEQAASDLRELRAFEDFSGKRGRHHKLEGSEIGSVQVGAGWREILLTVCDFCSFGSGRGGDYHSQGGRSYRCYLVVRDSTTGEAHVLRVPPKFGNSDTNFYGTFASDRARVAGAVAWTFGMEGRQYRPQVTA